MAKTEPLTIPDAARQTNESLNPEQRQAAETLTGPVIMIAGAGAGKTRTLIHRVASMLLAGVPPTEIMVVTFTNKAASEIKERLNTMVGESGQHVCAGTFHSIVFREILRMHPDSPYLRGAGIDMNECSILDQDDSTAFLKDALKSLPDDEARVVSENEWSVGTFEKLMTLERAQGHTPEHFRQSIHPGSKSELFQRVALSVWERYNRACRDANGIDFDDILVYASQLVEREPEVARELASRFRYLMLDEYQDTNPVQMRIMDAIAHHHHNICVVGDEKQSIYGFRGSDIEVILGFKQRYPGASQIDMTRNYRSLPELIRVCNACADAMNERLSHGQLTAMRAPEAATLAQANRAHLLSFPDDRVEADRISDALDRDLRTGKRGSQIAVLYRNREEKSDIEKRLWDKRIPYHVVGDTSFFKKAEVKDVISLIRFVFQPWDSAAGLRLLRNMNLSVSENRAKKALSEEKTTVHAFLADESTRRLKTAAKKGETPPLSKTAQKVGAFLQLADTLREAYKHGESALFIKEALAEMWDIYLLPAVKRLANQASGSQTQNVEARVSNVLHVLDRFQEEVEKDAPVDEIIQDFTMMAENHPDLDMDMDAKVRLMTIHASKGLEFDHVYLIGADNTALPGDTDDPSEIEEARRVAYVAMTRAREKIVVSHARRKFHRGMYIDTRISPFIDEITRRTGLTVQRFEPEPSRTPAATACSPGA